MSHLQHGLEVIVLGGSVDRFLIQTIAAGDVFIPVTPQQSHEIDAFDHTLMLARPLAIDPFHLLGIEWIQHRVV